MVQTELFTSKDEVFLKDAKKHNSCHWQLKLGEIFVGNHDVREGLFIHHKYLSGLKTARLGEQAYDVHGQPIERWYYRPLIVHKSEIDLYDKIMNDRPD